MKIAISGKGGVGKTTISAALIRQFAGRGFKIIAVDADPDSSLAEILGLPEEKSAALKPIVGLREELAALTGGQGSYYSLNPPVNELLESYSINFNGIKFLKMGAVKQGGTSCYCRESSVLNSLINVLLLKKEEMVVMDMSAGIEHLTRGTAQGVDLMAVITEPSRVSIRTAQTVRDLSREIGIKNINFIANKIRDEREKNTILTHLGEDNLLGVIPYDESVRKGSIEGVRQRTDSEFERAIASITEAILGRQIK